MIDRSYLYFLMYAIVIVGSIMMAQRNRKARRLTSQTRLVEECWKRPSKLCKFFAQLKVVHRRTHNGQDWNSGSSRYQLAQNEEICSN